LKERSQIVNDFLGNIVIVKTYPVHGLLIKGCAIAIPKDSKVFIFALHALDVPVVNFFRWIGRV